jgi:hypothetical protein
MSSEQRENAMKTSLLLAPLAVAALSLNGCASVYTNIEKTGDNTYLVTHVKQGFFVVSGNLYQCQVQAETRMKCREIATP